MEKDILYQLALSRIHGIGPARARNLIRHFGAAKAIFQANLPSLAAVCGPKCAKAIVQFDEFFQVEKEQAYLERYSMRCLFITDKDYPQRLLSHSDAPILLYYKGNADLNTSRVISVVGTRSPSEYGQQATEYLIKQLAACSQSPASLSADAASTGPSSPCLLIVSGLAYGIDGIAHQAALDNHLPTLGILGHGLDRIYPQQHAPLARQMVQHGGLLTQFSIGTEVEEYRFPMRNKLVAALSDALVIIETASRGGSLLTAGNALKYKKKIFALPGRINDPKSSGCNEWIRKGKALLLNDGRQLMEEMGWAHPFARPVPTQTSLFSAPDEIADLSENEKRLLYFFREKEKLTHDELSAASQSFSPEMAMALLNLELQGRIRSLPGKKYQLQP